MTRVVQQQPGVPQNSVVFFAYKELNVDPADVVQIFTAQLGWQPYCITDIIVANPALIIPSRLFIPHQGSRRREAFLQRGLTHCEIDPFSLSAS